MRSESTSRRHAVLALVVLLALGAWLAPSAASAAGRVALVVGNGAYGEIGTLPNPGNDAADVAAALGRLGFEVTTVRDADRAGLTAALRAFARQSAGADVSLVFYAGHGLEVDGVNYLVPVDARLERDTDVRFETVALYDVLASTVGASLRVVILDACRNNPLSRSMRRTGAARSISRGSFGELNEALLGDETLVAYAAAAGTTAADGTGRNSPYTSALLAYLERPLEIGILFRQVRAQVLATTNGEQRPHEYQSLLGEHYLGGGPAPGNAPGRDPRLVEAGLGLDRSARRRVQRGLAAAGFSPGPADGVFGPGTRAAIRRWQSSRGAAATGYLDTAGAQALGVPVASPAQSGVGSVAGATPASVRAQQENLFWQSVVSSRNPADFEAYLRQFPDGIYAELARNRVTALRPAVESAASDPVAGDRPQPRAPGTVFRDCPTCPEMVVVPAGRFRMGWVSGREVSSFALGVYEVTFEEYERFARATGRDRPNDRGWGRGGRGGRPVINVSWEDAQAYAAWLSDETGEDYRLPSEAEWEYAARAGSTTRYSWGQDIGRNRANCNGCGSRWDDDETAPAGSFAPNDWGLHDMHGNVWEWVEDCWHYAGAPRDGSAWTSGGDCGLRVLRGGSAPRGCSCAISVFQTRRCASVSTSNSVRSRSAPTVSGTSTAGATGCVSTRGARRAPPPERRHRGSKTWPDASRSVNAAQQLARCKRPRPSRKSNASQTWSATCPRLSTPCETAPFTTSRSRARLPRRLRPT